MPIPDFVTDAPTLGIGSQFVYSAYQSLNSCRSFNEAGVGRIPWNCIMDYADRLEMSFYEADEFCELIERIDSNYVKKVNG